MITDSGKTLEPLKGSGVMASKPPNGKERLSEPVTELEQCCSQDLLGIVSHLRKIVFRDPEKSGFPITLQQYYVLKTLKQERRLISELADIFMVSRPSMTRIIDGLEGRKRNSGLEDDFKDVNLTELKGKLVERVDCVNDGRLVYAQITAEGLEILRSFGVKADEAIAQLIRRIDPQEIPQLQHSLQVLREALDTDR